MLEFETMTVDDEANEKMHGRAQELFASIDKEIEPVTQILSEVKVRWFEALDMQESSDQLQRKIEKKLDKLVATRKEVSDLVDAISLHVQVCEAVDVNGDSSDMMV